MGCHIQERERRMEGESEGDRERGKEREDRE